MAYGLSNGHVTDDVTWPWKIKLVTPLRLERNISKTTWARDFKFGLQLCIRNASRPTNNFPESGRGLGYVIPTIFGIRSNISLKLLELETSNLIHGFVWAMPSRRTNKFSWKWAWPRSRDPLQFLTVRSAILATAWLLVTVKFHWNLTELFSTYGAYKQTNIQTENVIRYNEVVRDN